MTKPLAVRVLEVATYPHHHGIPSKTHVYSLPSWEQIEVAIRSLNHDSLPFLFIGLRDKCQGKDCLRVLGGPNGFALTAEVWQEDQVQFCDPSHTGGTVGLWIGPDQLFCPPERYVTYDVELVVRLTRYYAEHGQLDPSVQWNP